MTISVLIATPCGDDMRSQTTYSIIAAEQYLTNKGYRAGWAEANGTYPDQGQNLAAQMAAETKCNYLWLVDSDMKFPHDMGERLIKRNHDIVGCDYRRRKYPYTMTGVTMEGKQTEGGGANGEIGCKEVRAIATGCMMIKVPVFAKIPWPWFCTIYGTKPGEFTTGDVAFCQKAREHGFKIFCDFYASKEVYHLGVVPLSYDEKPYFPKELARNVQVLK